ncbi:MAG: DUF433 domain-containing protein [Acidobacteria bacterium]|jgi:uncharacterized protein (DUF433 family)|nr:DUF433 domain-containing protein [Acidobacteriota bacterium]
MPKRISVNPKIHFGKPCITGTRIPVQNILELVQEGVPFEEIVRDYYPDITVFDIRACLQYAIEIIAAEDINITPEAA